MNQRRHRWSLNGNRVVIGHDHLHIEFGGSLQCRNGSNPVINGHEQPDPLGLEAFDHADIQSVTVIHPGGDRSHRVRSESSEGTNQQGRAGHAVGVVIPADRQGFSASAGLGKTFGGRGQIRELLLRIRQLRWIQQMFRSFHCSNPPTLKQAPQRQGQIHLRQWGRCDHLRQGPAPER